MYSTMRPQHKAQDCGTGASLSLRRQCWASDRCCYEYDSHVSGLWASQGQWVAGACQRLSCKRRLSRTTYLCLQRCGKSVPCPPVRLICIFCACLVPYELVALTHTLTTALILTHTHTHMLQLLHLWNSTAVSLFVVVAFVFYELFWQFPAGLRQATHRKGNYRWMNSAHYTPLLFPPSRPHPHPHPIPKWLAHPLPLAGAALPCSALLWAGHNFWNVLTCTRLYADLLAVAVLWQICFAHLMWFCLPRALHSCAYLPSPLLLLHLFWHSRSSALLRL